MFAGCGRDNPPASPRATTAATEPVAAEPKPTGPVPATQSCVTPACHANFRNAVDIHGPVAAGACSACHDRDQGGHTYPVIRQGNATCTFCHAVAGTKAHQHKVIEQQGGGPGTGGCLGCHDPHVSKVKYLLVTNTVERLCLKCHNLPLKKDAHQPFAAGQCTVCHQPHQSDFATLLRNGEGPEHCFGCHTDKRTLLAQSPHVHKAAQQSCTVCHGAHSTDNPKLLKQTVNDGCLGCHPKVKEQLAAAKIVHGAVTDGCTTCHDPHASANPAVTKARMDKLCLTCHDKPIQTDDGHTIASVAVALRSKNLHGPVRTGSCSECHQAHAADLPNLLKKASPDTFYASFDLGNYALCFSCHDKAIVLRPMTTTLTNFRDGEKNLHYLHVNRGDKGRTCKTCHETHGSDLPFHLAASVPFEGSAWAMPLRYEQTPTGGSCAPGCHDQKSYHRGQPATAGSQPAERGAP